MSIAAQPAALPALGETPKGRTPLAHLLHALNQPLTGLQCSLELAAGGPRRPEEYVRTLREGMELTARMRILVEALRALADMQQPENETVAAFDFAALLRELAAELVPVAESRNVGVELDCDAPSPVAAQRWHLHQLLFRLLDAVLALACPASKLALGCAQEKKETLMRISFQPGPLPKHSPFSPAELSLLIVRAAWEQAGGEWRYGEGKNRQTFTLRLPSAPLGSGGPK